MAEALNATFKAELVTLHGPDFREPAGTWGNRRREIDRRHHCAGDRSSSSHPGHEALIIGHRMEL